MKTYSLDLRQRVVDAWDNKNGTQPELAQRFKVSLAWIKKVLRMRRTRGSIEPLKRGGRRPAKFVGEDLERLRKLVEAKPDATLEELREQSGVNASIMAVFRALQRLGFGVKKSRYGQRNKIGQRSKSAARLGVKKSKRSIRIASFSSTKVAPRPI